MCTPIIINMTLPNLRWFGFRGVSAYMEAVVRRISTPRLDIRFFNRTHVLLSTSSAVHEHGG